MLALSLASLLMMACAQVNEVTPEFSAPNSGVSGRLFHSSINGETLSPTAPASGRIYVRTADHQTLVAEIDTDEAGDFQVPLKPGSYSVFTVGNYGGYGRPVTVRPNEFQKVTLYLPPGS